MTASHNQRSWQRTCVQLVKTVCAVWAVSGLAPRGIEAACGDYLLPPAAFAQHFALAPELVASGLQSPHQERPCRGPNCRRAPVQPSQPAPSTILVTDLWADLPADTEWHPCRVSAFSLAESDPSGVDRTDRLDRPPQP